MLHIHGPPGVKEYAEPCFGNPLTGSQDHLIFLPFFGIHDQSGGCESLLFLHGGPIHQLHPEGIPRSLRRSRPNRKTVFLLLFNTDSEKSFILQSRVFVVVPRPGKAHIMGIPLKRSVIPEFNLAKGTPPRKTLWKFEGAVFHQLRIKPTIGGIVDVLEEQPVHGGLDFSPLFVNLDQQLPWLRHQQCRCKQGGNKRQKKVSLHNHEIIHGRKYTKESPDYTNR